MYNQPARRPIEKVALISKRVTVDNPDHVKCIKKIVNYLKKKDKEVLFDTNLSALYKNTIGHRKTTLLKEADLVLTLGGDGTLLKTARRLSKHVVYILGVNLGNLGFLTETTAEKVLETLDDIFDEKYTLDRRSLLRVTIYRKGEKIETFLALNDAVINQGAFARLIQLDLELDGRKLAQIKSDGLIIATPTGSTAHSLAAGGPIVHPNLECLAVTPICPNSLAMRPIIIPDNKQLTVTIETQRREENHFIGLTIDGQDIVNLQYGDKVKFRRSSRYLYLIRTRNRYYRVLRRKLGWGEI